MNRKELIPVWVVSIILLVYSFLIVAGSSSPVISLIFFVSPFLMIWLVYNVIRHGEYKGPEFKENQEWGYADRDIKMED
jgi:hypothetical protein